mgnify:CR=1 FL=1
MQPGLSRDDAGEERLQPDGGPIPARHDDLVPAPLERVDRPACDELRLDHPEAQREGDPPSLREAGCLDEARQDGASAAVDAHVGVGRRRGGTVLWRRSTKLAVNLRGQETVDKILAGQNVDANLALLRDLCHTMKFGSLCALGGFAPYPVESALRHFPEDFHKPALEAAAE